MNDVVGTTWWADCGGQNVVGRTWWAGGVVDPDEMLVLKADRRVGVMKETHSR